MTLNVIHVISLMTFRINYVNNYDFKYFIFLDAKTQMPAQVVIRQV